MTLKKKRKPTSSSQRHLYLIDRTTLSKEKPLSNKTQGLSKKSGRNNQGRITVATKRGGHKRKYREIDFKRQSNSGIVTGLEHDPNRSTWIARIKGEEEFYILAPNHLQVGDFVSSKVDASVKLGNSLLLKNMPLGATIHNVELKPGKGGQLIRSAGSSGLLIHKGQKYARIRLPSGIQRLVPLTCRATIGSLSNKDYQNQVIGKAGRSRWLGIRPNVRGVAMNPIDHPHGGGEGKSSGGRPSVTPWGRPTKGQPTRSMKKTNKLILRSSIK
jgi:large subunit ribosomal protein L2